MRRFDKLTALSLTNGLRAQLMVSDRKARAERTPHPVAQSVQESVVQPDGVRAFDVRKNYLSKPN